MAILAGIHPIQEALRSGRALDRVVVAKGAGSPKLQEIIDTCRERGIPVRFERRQQLDRTASTSAHQGVIALIPAREYSHVEDLIGAAQLLVALDGVEDPHNLGAIIRTAEAAGAGGVLIPERRAAGITDAAAKASAGAIEHLPVARTGNLSQALERLKRAGFWIYGLDERGENLYGGIEFNRPTVFVLGGEGKGLHEHVKRHCDALVRIPMSGRISSLNVSVAAGVALFEWRRRTMAAAPEPG
ncbi:MAG TPA: 23S rRNA (guanosine(2251)-2'-O)-methyltransferase RlmB [Bryobacteraceae bacterium]|nr:23S rRNA (guanosine(2251)-2'-O)-methyltransferase RlmB [Bryobacteraceae bacterium]